MPLRIIAVSNRYLPIIGGAERQLALLSSELKKRGHQIQILTRQISAELPLQELMEDVPIRRLQPTGLGKLANALIIPRVITYLFAHQNEYDVIHCQSIGPISIACIISGQILNKPVVLRVAGSGNIVRQPVLKKVSLYTKVIRRYIVSPRIWRGLLNQANTIIVLSQELIEEAASQKITAPIHLIPNGVDTNLFFPPAPADTVALRKHLGFSRKNPILFSIGRLVAGKRFDVLLNAMPQILREYPDCLLIIAGTGAQQIDDVEEELGQQVKSLGISNHVQFIGAINNVVEYLQAADVFVFPSAKEGMPNAVLEALATGIPIIASRIGGVTDIVDETCADLVPVGDVDAFAESILSALNKPQETEAKVMRGRQRAEQQFSIQAVADKYETMFYTLVEKQDRSNGAMHDK